MAVVGGAVGKRFEIRLAGAGGQGLILAEIAGVGARAATRLRSAESGCEVGWSGCFNR